MRKIGFVLAAILLAGILAACTDDDTAEQEQERIIPVETVEAEEGDLVIERTIHGRTAPSSTTPIMLQAPGEVERLEVTNGSMVEEDDLIATIVTAAGKQNIRATKSGEILQIQADKGEIASTEETFAIIADLDTIQLDFSVTATIHSLLEVDDKLTAVIDHEELEATVKKIEAIPDDTGLYPVEATVANDESNILPGMVAALRIPEATITETILVPTSAIVQEGDDAFVYTITDDTANKKEITIEKTQSDKTAIEGDIQEGDLVVTNGQLTLTDGATVDASKGE